MIASNALFYHLKDLGLNNYESKIWVVLLSKGTATASDLAELSGVPRSRAYDVLESLERKGFAVTRIGKPVQYMALEPKRVLNRLKNDIRKTSEERLQFMEKITDDSLFHQLMDIYEQGEKKTEDKEKFNLLSGRTIIYEKLLELINKAEKEVVFHTSSSGLVRKQKIFSPALKKAAERGVKVSFFIDDEIPHPFAMKDFVDVIPLQKERRYVVIDEHVVIFFKSDRDTQSGNDKAFWVHSPFLSNTFFLLHKDSTNVKSATSA